MHYLNAYPGLLMEERVGYSSNLFKIRLLKIFMNKMHRDNSEVYSTDTINNKITIYI
jgi:hypothetical protein